MNTNKTVRLVVVDDKDNPIALKTYAELRYEDIYRVSALWLTDKNTGSCLITQRKLTKCNDPGKWMAAASGTIEEGESYISNMVKEIEEEIGLSGLDLVKDPTEFVDDGRHKFFVRWFTATVDKDLVTIKIQEDEVEDYACVDRRQLAEDVHKHTDKYVPSMENALKILGLV